MLYVSSANTYSNGSTKNVDGHKDNMEMYCIRPIDKNYIVKHILDNTINKEMDDYKRFINYESPNIFLYSKNLNWNPLDVIAKVSYHCFIVHFMYK